jgi:hypothetical protein
MIHGMSSARTLSRRLSALTALAIVLLATAFRGSVAAASELRASATSAGGILVHDADETLRDYCRNEGGRLYLVLPGGSRWELVTSTTDPEVTNPGDGAFHAFDRAEVAEALAEVRFPVHQVSAEVFILPYPRRLSLESAAGPGLILLSPGVRPLSREHQHSEFVHELGHVVQYALFPDADADGWSKYARLRGIDAARFNAAAPHADRPHEIWAEDFRALFGGPSASSNGTIENASLSYPTQVQGLAAFMQGVAAVASRPAPARLTASAFAWGAISFSRSGARASVLDVYDAGGRRLAAIAPAVAGAGVSWSWDGRDAAGRMVRGTVVFARPRDGEGGTVRVTRLP